MEYLEIFLVLISLLLICHLCRSNHGPTNWPVVGMLPGLLLNVHRIHDYVIEITHNSQLTFFLKGPWFSNMKMLATVDPSNVHHIMSKNFGNYPKGPKLNAILDVLGDGIFNTDFNVWQYHRKMAHSFLGHPKFHHFLVKRTWDKIENGLIPVLDHVSEHSLELDLQDVFSRFTFDTICTIIMDYDPRALAVGLPSVPPSKALDDVEEVIFYRHVVPSYVWKLLRWLDVGKEKKHRIAWKILDEFIYKCIDIKREKLSKEEYSKQKEDNDYEVGNDLLNIYIEQDENQKTPIANRGDSKFLRDTILNFFVAGRDTTSATLTWFFYLLSQHPEAVSKIKKELDEVKLNRTNFKEVGGQLVYLHGALCETLRLYPPVVFEAKSPIEPDVLPSGHHVNPNMQIVFDMYAMGRSKSIWGEDCYEFKPERWISERGKSRHEPSYKFFAFNAGPRTCLGRDMAFTQMKIIAATIIKNYDIEVVKEHQVVPNLSIILHMKYGFKVKVHRSQ